MDLFKRFDKGAYLYLPSYVMRTHGARQQRDTVKRTPREQLKPVFEVSDLCIPDSAERGIKELTDVLH